LRLLKGKLTVNGTFNLDGFESTIDGTLAGSGLFQQTGSGITTLNGDGSSFSGVYELFGGQFNVGGNGKLGGTMQVNAGTILAGTGQIGALNNNGSVRPGNGSVGTLKLTQFGLSPAANYTQGSGGTLTVAVVTPTSNSLLQAQGSATLDGALETLWQGSSIPHNNTVFGTILSAADGISGRFASLLGNKISPTLFFMPQYDRATEVYLLTERDYAASDLVSSLTGNQRAISQMLNPLVNSASGDLDTVLDKIDNLTTNAQVAAAFDQLSPIAGVAYTNMTSGVASFQTGNVASRLGDLRLGAQGYSFQGLENLEFLAANSSRQPLLLASNSDDLQGMIPVEPDPRWGFFVKGNLVLGDQKDTAAQRGYDFKNGGLTLGTDYRFSERFVGGVLFGTNAAKSWINDAGSTVKLDGYTLGIYGTYFREAFYIDGQAGYGWNSFDNSRRIVFPGIDRTATAKPSGSQTTAYGGTGYDFQFGPWTIGPALTFQYLSMGVNGYTEAGADSLNLQVDRQTTESYQGSAGVKGSWNWTKDKLKIAPRLWAFYRHEFGNVNPATTAALAQGSSAFTIESVAPERNFFNVGTGINVHWTDSVLAYLNYEVQLGQSNYTAQSITLGLRLQF
jgi:outer membrane autotransporter protein